MHILMFIITWYYGEFAPKFDNQAVRNEQYVLLYNIGKQIKLLHSLQYYKTNNYNQKYI